MSPLPTLQTKARRIQALLYKIQEFFKALNFCIQLQEQHMGIYLIYTVAGHVRDIQSILRPNIQTLYSNIYL